MASTSFVNGTIIQAAWLNDVNSAAYSGGWHNFSVKNYGAVGDGITDDTEAVTDALQSGAEIVYFPVGTYLVNNISIPNGTVRLIGEGRNQTSIKAISSIDNTTALVAGASYWANSTNAGQQFIAEGITFDGNSLVQYPLVMYNQYAQVKDCGFINPQSGGSALFVTGAGITGGTNLSPIQGAKVLNCWIDGATVASAARVVDPNVKTKDMVWEGNIFTRGASAFGALLGHSFNNNTFEDAATFTNISTGTRIYQNNFQGQVALESWLIDVVRFSNNTCGARVIVSFGIGGTIVMDDNIFHSTADVFHNSNDATKHLIVMGGGFTTATPLVFSSGTSVGRATFSRVWDYGSGALLEGSATGNTGGIRRVYWGTAAPTTGTWAVGDQTFNVTPSAAGTPGWVCTGAGTPGTWNARAAVAA